VAGCCEWGNEPSGFHKMRGISGLAEDRLDSQEGLCSLEFCSHLSGRFIVQWGIKLLPYSF
jgi:hypothetical protein